MSNKQRGETRKTNDFMRFLDDSTFNLGVELDTTKENEKELNFDVTLTTSKPVKLKSSFAMRFERLLKEKHVENKTELGRQIAKAIGKDKPITRQTIDNYLNGRTAPTMDVIIFLCNYFGCSSDYLLGFSEHTTVNDKSICEQIGITQEVLDYLRAERRNCVNTTADCLNLLVKDRALFQSEAHNKVAAKDRKASNALEWIWRYLNVEQLNDRQYILPEDWLRIAELTERLFDDLDLDRAGKLDYLEENIRKLKLEVDNANEKGRVIKDTAIIETYRRAVDDRLRKLRIQQQQAKGI